jgi:hypothetical protein
VLMKVADCVSLNIRIYTSFTVNLDILHIYILDASTGRFHQTACPGFVVYTSTP